MSERETYFQKLTPRETELAWTGMKFDFQRIEKWHKAGQDAWNVSSGSLLDAVDGLNEPLQVSHLIGYLLHTAVDHLHALKTLLADANAQHTFAPYTLIRGSIEAASTVLWVLQDDVARRVARRALTLEYQNLKDQRRATKLVDAQADFDPELMDVLKQVLGSMDLTLGMVKDPPHVSTIIRDVAESFELPASQLTWQMCSAAAHGRPWAKQFLTLFEAIDDDGVSKTLSGQLTSNHLAMAISLNTACDVVDKARTVRNSYSRNPNHTGESFTKPSNRLHLVKNSLLLPKY
ncbi:hypothetical protein [Paenarthrobacter aurescens]|uniref:hypothetical protein n=1 Tax=Paenarthrobacter aurescens TaxID=43663 RepID=UPI0021C12BD5|nr:hypothetical protein [Paenarthrobacter aurescens]MCT9868352.1 hypothetical protein [Paenarthrobacter aurescens]